MENEVAIDGAMGEGGGQIVRTCLALSMVTGKGVTLSNIRLSRKKPGLQRQHLMAVAAASEISHADVDGARLGSTTLRFIPGRVRPGTYHFDIGSAGSVTLVLQTILPPLVLADRPSHIILSGGTHNPLAPPVDFLQKSFLPLIRRMGPHVTIDLKRHGFYPAGGGVVEAVVHPAPKLQRIELSDRGRTRRISVSALVSRLPETIGEREIKVVTDALQVDRTSVTQVRSPGPGNVLIIEIDCDHVTEIVTAFGERGLPAEEVARNALVAAESYIATGAPVGPHLADQLLLPMALAPEGGCFRTGKMTLHALTNMDVIKRFLDVSFKIVEVDEKVWQVDVGSKRA